MDIGELVAAFEVNVDKDEHCGGAKSDPTNWKSRINDWGTLKNCSVTRLYGCMEKDKDKKQGFLGRPIAFVAKPGVPGYKWYFEKLGPTHFPVQAHHLIPKNHLPNHAVCTFLAKSCTKSKKYQLTADTFYDTDHANNGYCLPYATPLVDWKSAGDNDSLKLTIAFEVMETTNRQLHQGSHRAAPYDGPIDDDEEAKIHPTGYLNAVTKYLKIVQGCAQKHVNGCSVCKPNNEKKDIQPIQAVVRHMDQVSGIIKLLIDANRIFISEPAHIWWQDRKKNLARPRWLKA